MNESWKSAQKQMCFYICACVTIITFYFCHAVGMNTYSTYIGDTNFTRIFPFRTWYLLWEDVQHHTPYLEFLTVVGGCDAYIAGMAAVSFDGFYVYMTVHGVALIQILKEMIAFTTSDNVPKHLRIAYLRQCIQHYDRTIIFCNEVNGLYSIVNLAQLLISLVVFGAVLFQTSIGLEADFIRFINMILYSCAAGYELVIYCFNGQKLSSETESLTFSWYSCKWYDECIQFRKLVYMMIIRSVKTMHVEAGGFTTMSLPTFQAILKTSGSYFMIWRRVNSKN